MDLLMCGPNPAYIIHYLTSVADLYLFSGLQVPHCSSNAVNPFLQKIFNKVSGYVARCSSYQDK